MNWNAIKKEIDTRLVEEGLGTDIVFSWIDIYDSASKLDIFFNDDGQLCVQGKNE